MARTAAPDLTAPAANVIRADRVRVRPSGSENDRILLAKSLQGEKSGSYLGFWLRWTGPEPFFYPNWRYDASRFSRTGSAPSNSPAVSEPLWNDEGFTWWAIGQSWHDLWTLVPQGDPHPPLYY